MAKDMDEKTNSSGFESKPAPDQFASDLPNSFAVYKKENGSEGACQVGNTIPNPFGPSANKGDY